MPRIIPDGWLREYLRYTSGQESPDIFHLWVAMTVIASTLERNVWLDRGFYTLFPNLYTILVAGSAVCRKSVAVGIGEKILSSIDNPPTIFAQKMTPEAIINDLANVPPELEGAILKDKATALIYASELSVFLGRSAYESGLLALLTTLYDSPNEWTYSTKTQGRQELFNVCLNLLGASTPTWLRDSVPGDAIGGGFMSRCVLVYHDQPKRPIAFPVVGDDVKRMRDRLVQDLNQIRNLRGEFQMTSGAREWYEKWYADEIGLIQSEEFGEFLVRRPDTLLKLGMIISASEGDSMTIDVSHLEIGVKALDDIKETIHKSIDPIVTAPTSVGTMRVAEIIERHGEITHRKLLQQSVRFANAEAIAQIIDTLIQAEIIELDRGPRGGRVYKYKGTGKDIKG